MTFVKYPKTMHLPWSPGLQNDDRRIENLDFFEGKRVIVTEKLDGENTTMYHDAIHARSIDGRHHPSRDWVKAFHGQIKHLWSSSDKYRLCGENVYAEHSIKYENLKTYFYGFSFWEGDMCWDWDYTIRMFKELGVEPVPVLYDGIWCPDLIRAKVEDPNIYRDRESEFKKDPFEGYVVRVADEFHINDFQKAVAKFVRKDHVQTDQHWMAKPVVPNGLRKDESEETNQG